MGKHSKNSPKKETIVVNEETINSTYEVDEQEIRPVEPEWPTS